jgi:hypothetical protein
MNKRSRWGERNPLDLAVARGLRKRGYSLDTIAGELGVSRDTITLALDPARLKRANETKAEAARARTRSTPSSEAREKTDKLVALWRDNPDFNPGT